MTQGLLALSLERSGVGVDNVKTRSMGGLAEGLTALKNGDIDAAAILEPVYSEQVEEEGWKPVFRASDYVPEFLSTVIITGPGCWRTTARWSRRRSPPAPRASSSSSASRTASPRPGPRRRRSTRPARRRRWRPIDPDEHWVVGLDSPEALRDGRGGDAADRPPAGRPGDRLEPARRPGLRAARPADHAARRRTSAAERREARQGLREPTARSRPCATSRSSVDEGEFVSIVGPSGCGKSTLMEIVGGLIEPTAGEITIAGRPVDGTDPAIGIVFQQESRLPVAHGRRERRVRARDDRRGQGRAAQARAGDDRARRPEGLRGALSGRAQRRHAPARRDRPHARAGARS